jgi:hypothetical protein
MKHQEMTRPVEIAGLRCRSDWDEGREIGAQRGEHVTIRREPRFELMPATEGSAQPPSACPRCFPQLAR